MILSPINSSVEVFLSTQIAAPVGAKVGDSLDGRDGAASTPTAVPGRRTL